MIFVTGEMRFGAGEGAKAAALLAQHAQACQAEEGCDLYSFAFDVGDPDLVRVIERWASPEALAAHGTADHQKAFGRALRQFTINGMRIDAWAGEHWRTLIGG